MFVTRVERPQVAEPSFMVYSRRSRSKRTTAIPLVHSAADTAVLGKMQLPAAVKSTAVAEQLALA